MTRDAHVEQDTRAEVRTESGGGDRERGPIRVFLLDDHEVVRRGVHDLLDGEPDLTVVGQAGTAAQALARVPALRPDVAVLDVRLPDGDGVGVCRELRSRMPELACLMLTSFDDEEALLDAIMAGASGYVLKQITGTDLVAAVRGVASGQSLLDPGATARVMARLRGGERPEEGPPGLATLTAREREVLTLVGEGLTNREIGERLHLAEKTVKNNISRLLAKLGVERRVQAAVLAAQLPAQPVRPGGDGRPARHGRPG
ncbi:MULTISPECIES: response regulator transcription factor [Streptomyces]|uniref:Response regulator transcription factor n=1 Tax=Streptomyces lichenis TaxID=2306967 RepID=A0ABT0I9U6_9ACTN|nr:response regulator transcription factor [Streptomyces lichenis]MCK8678094.1 response regulator transcription factor [Streptomyces lichenis]